MDFLTVPDLVELLGLPVGKIHRLIEDHTLPATRVDGIVKVPADFVNGGEAVPALRGTVMMLRDAGWSQDEAVNWLLTENDDLGEAPIAALRRGSKRAVRRAAQVAEAAG